MTFPSKKFEICMPENQCVSILLCGASRAGKTTLLKHLYQTYFSKHITTMFTMNSHADIYKDLSKDMMVANTFHPELLREAQEINSLCDNKYNFLWISDDYVGKEIKCDKEVVRVMTVGRNCGQSSIWSAQGRTLLSAIGRNNANYIMILKQQTPLEWECVIKEFLSMWLPTGMRMKEMVEFCKIATQNYQMFVIDNLKGECYLTKLTKEQAGL